MTRSNDAGNPVVEHLNPEGVHKNPAYSQGVAVRGPARTIYVGGQNAVDASGAIVGTGDLGRQTEQVINNVALVLEAGGARLTDVIKWNIHVVAGQNIGLAFAAYQRAMQATAAAAKPGAVTAAFVSGLARPEYLIEIEAVAIVP